MPSLADYKQYVLKNHSQTGTVHKNNADLVIEQTWENDVSAVKAYIYDYYHDDQKESEKGYNPTESLTKTPIDAKFFVDNYNTLSKDQVPYLLQFKPTQDNPLEYFETKYKAEFPVGLYIDIPDNKGVYRKWLICDRSFDRQFVKYNILPCNYELLWIDNVNGTPTKRRMWGVSRSRNSYNSGIWTDYKFTTIENQDQFWLPVNDISIRITYNQRLIVSALMDEPITWQVTKPEHRHPFGVAKLTLYQTKFDTEHDYVNFDTGEMWADYFSYGITPTTQSDITTSDYVELRYSGKSMVLKVNGTAKKMTAILHEGGSQTEDITPNWNIVYDGNVITESNEDIIIRYEDNKLFFTAISENALNKTITVKATVNGIESEAQELYITAL